MIDSEDIASVLVPLPVNAANLTSVTAGGVALAEDGNPAWSAGAPYGIGDRVHSAATHRVYESLKAGNTGKDPTTPVNQTTAAGVGTWWLDIGPTNKYAAFDGLISTPTVAASPLVITFHPGPFNGLAMLAIDADTVSVQVRSSPGGPIIYSYSSDLDASDPPDWYEYFFDPFKPQTQAIITRIEPYGNAEGTVTLTNSSGTVKLGMLAFGDVRPLGVPERGTRVAPKTYSVIVEDAFGNTRIQKRPKATNMTLPIKVPLESADSVVETLQELLDVPAVVIGSTAQFHTRLTTYGLISGEMDYSTYPDRTLNLTVKGLI